MNKPIQRIKVPSLSVPKHLRLVPEFKVGDMVCFYVNHKRPGFVPFMASGKIISINPAVFGGRVTKQGARIKVGRNYLQHFPGRVFTVIAVDNLHRM